MTPGQKVNHQPPVRVIMVCIMKVKYLISTLNIFFESVCDLNLTGPEPLESGLACVPSCAFVFLPAQISARLKIQF